MARKKVKLEWIANDSARRATFKKRRKGLLKKVGELSTLCDVKACLIVYAPSESQPEVWPSPQEANRVLAKLRRLPEMEQSKKMMNQEGFMRHRIGKLQEQIRKQGRENRELETLVLMHQGLKGKIDLQSTEARGLTSLAWLVELKLKEVRKRLELLSSEMAAKVEIKKEELPPMAEIVKEASSSPTPSPEAKEKMEFNEAMEDLQRQDWYSEIMNPQEEILANHPPYFEQGSPAWMESYFLKN